MIHICTLVADLTRPKRQGLGALLARRSGVGGGGGWRARGGVSWSLSYVVHASVSAQVFETTSSMDPLSSTGSTFVGNRVIDIIKTSDEEVSISHHASICEKTFEKLLATKCIQCGDERGTPQASSVLGANTGPKLEPPLKCLFKRDLVEEYYRFIVWSTNAGIFASADHSLDQRLQTLNDIRDSFLLQLTVIKARLLHLLRSPSFRGEQKLAPSNVAFQKTGGSKDVTSSAAHVHESAVKQSANTAYSGLKPSSPSQGDLPSLARQSRYGQRAHSPVSTTSSSEMLMDLEVSAIKQDTGRPDPRAEYFRRESRSMNTTLEKPPKTVRTSVHQDLQESLLSIRSCINWLQRLSNVVKTASMASQNRKADGYRLEDQGINSVDLRKFYDWFLKREFAGLREPLRQRLADSVMLRRRRFEYKARVQELFEKQQAHTTAHEAASFPPSSASTETMLGDMYQTEPWSPVTTTSSSSKAQTKHQAGDLNAANPFGDAPSINAGGLRKSLAKSRISAATTIPLGGQTKFLLPPKPRESAGATFTCGYCSHVLDSEIARDDKTWG